MKINVKDIAVISILSIILFVQEELLNFLPNISLTVFLIVLYSKKMGMIKTYLIIIIYCLLDNVIMNSFNIVFTPFMLLGWLVIPLTLNTIFEKVNNIYALSLIGGLHSLIYCWIFIIPSVLFYQMDIKLYIISDIPFEIPLAISSIVSILLLYKPCSKVFERYLLKNN